MKDEENYFLFEEGAALSSLRKEQCYVVLCCVVRGGVLSTCVIVGAKAKLGGKLGSG